MRENVQQFAVTDEIQTWEIQSLRFQVVLVRFCHNEDIMMTSWLVVKKFTSKLLNTCSSRMLQALKASRIPATMVYTHGVYSCMQPSN